LRHLLGPESEVVIRHLLFLGVGSLALFVGVRAVSGERSFVPLSFPLPVPATLNLERVTFEFPGAGERNNNHSIGDFCCSGETATVRASQSQPLGYIYFHDFDGGITNGSRSAAVQFGVLVSGISNAAQPKSVRVKSSIEFNARELRPGLSRSTIAGALQFTATILDVQFVDEAHSRYWMDSIKVKVEVQEASPAQSAQPHPAS
jgi:hypothetical protein